MGTNMGTDQFLASRKKGLKKNFGFFYPFAHVEARDWAELLLEQVLSRKAFLSFQ